MPHKCTHTTHTTPHHTTPHHTTPHHTTPHHTHHTTPHTTHTTHTTAQQINPGHTRRRVHTRWTCEWWEGKGGSCPVCWPKKTTAAVCNCLNPRQKYTRGKRAGGGGDERGELLLLLYQLQLDAWSTYSTEAGDSRPTTKCRPIINRTPDRPTAAGRPEWKAWENGRKSLLPWKVCVWICRFATPPGIFFHAFHHYTTPDTHTHWWNYVTGLTRNSRPIEPSGDSCCFLASLYVRIRGMDLKRSHPELLQTKITMENWFYYNKKIKRLFNYSHWHFPFVQTNPWKEIWASLIFSRI